MKKGTGWKIFAAIVGVVIVMGLGGNAIQNTKDLFNTQVESTEESESTKTNDNTNAVYVELFDVC